ncbi:MAG: CBS domain-containing protein, partial [Candidatus Marinimicrobia bacterium]|nr:CBS domain-containing protein [Candidatus Neomarinimicrobiota bacterium]
MALSSIMTTPVVTVGPDDTLKTVKEIFDNVKFHHLLVVEEKRLFGVLSDRDLLKALSPWLGTLDELPRDRAILEKRVHQICSRQPITASMKTGIGEATRILIENNVSCLPVVTKRGRIKGIVTWKDIFRAY